MLGTLLGLLAFLAAIQSYYFREILAALLFLSIGFTFVFVVISALLLLDWSVDGTLAWTRAYAARVVTRLHRGGMHVGHSTRKH